MPHCQSCGNFGDGTFCGSCGAPLTAAQQPPGTPPARQAPPVPQAQARPPAPAPAPGPPPTAPPQPPAAAPPQQPAAAPPPAAAPAPAPVHGQSQQVYGQPAQGQAGQAYGQSYPQQTYGQPVQPVGTAKVASAYYIALVALVFAFLGGILGMVLALLAGWLGRKQQARGLAKAATAVQISNIAFLIATVMFIVFISFW